ncbi:MAG TPA: Holliday junction branch migration protein RuvA [Symbiobacteriaceae bacterium]
MIAHLRGTLVAAGSESVVVDVAGVGYRCLVPTSTRTRLPAVGEEVRLHTSLQVREDSLTLYGFLTREEYELFELLLRVEGIGPKVALGILSASTPEQIRRAIALEDITALCQVPGIGKKTAQRIVLELKDKVGTLIKGGTDAGAASVPAAPQAPDAYADALEALVQLGFSRSEAIGALERARSEAGPEARAEDLLRLSLKHLYRG